MRLLKVVGVTAILLVLGAGPVLAQGTVPNPSLGIRAGINSSKLQVSGGSSSWRNGYAFGGHIMLPMDTISLELDLLFNQKGFQKGEYQGLTDIEVKYTYLDLPLLARMDVVLSDNSHFFFYGGFYIGIKLDAQLKSSETDGQWEDIGDGVTSVVWGLNFGGGVTFHQFLLDLRYYYGLTNMNEEFPNAAELNDRTISVMLGYAFL